MIATAAVLASPLALSSAGADPNFPVGSPIIATPFAPSVAPATNDVQPAYGSIADVTSPQATNTTGEAQFYVYHSGTSPRSLVLAIAGSSSAYFPTSTGPAGTYVASGGTTATCTTVSDLHGNTDCVIDVADTAPEGITIGIGDVNDGSSTTQVVDFNGVHWSQCAQSGFNTAANCVTQGTVNTVTSETVNYQTGGQAGSSKNLMGLILTGSVEFAANQPVGTQVTNIGDTTASCTTNSTGSCTFNVVDAVRERASIEVFNQSSAANPYPTVSGTESINFVSSGGGPGNYVAMGDSFSSGEGLAPYLSGSHTTNPTDDCDRSSQAYGPELDNALGVGAMKFVACSGAVTQDFYLSNHLYHSEPAQLNALNASTEEVTLTIGATDAGLESVVEQCIHASTAPSSGYGCSNNATLVSTTNARIAALAGSGVATSPAGTVIVPITALLEKISQLAPNAVIAIAGYPHLFGSSSSNFQTSLSAPSGNSCQVYFKSHLLTASVDYTDAQWLNSEVDAVNSAIESGVSAAQTAGVPVRYVDAAASNFQGHSLCDSSNGWINPVVVSGGSVTPATFHPNNLGQTSGYESAFAALLNF
jgi:hypothetical protein